MLAAGAREEVRARRRRRRFGDGAQGARVRRSCSAGDVEAMKRRTRNYAKRQLTWMRKLAGVRVIDVTGPRPAAIAVAPDGRLT